MVVPQSARWLDSYVNSHKREKCYELALMSRKIVSQARSPPVLSHKARFPYQCPRTGCLGGRGRLGAAAPGARHVLGGRRWQRRPRVRWRAAGVQAVIGLGRLDTAVVLSPV